MYKVKKVYFISNDNLYSDGLLGESLNPDPVNVVDLSGESFNSAIPRLFLPYTKSRYLYVVWKIWVKDIFSKNTSINFIVAMGMELSYLPLQKKEHRLKYDDLSNLVGLGWIEYTVPIEIESNKFDWIQPSINITACGYPYSKYMKMDYIRFIQFERDQIYFPKMGHLSPFFKLHPNIPDAFEDEYFSKKEAENLIELEDI
ncbi:hypothetical protein C1645_760668, partial [Glomus cerebriforme]